MLVIVKGGGGQGDISKVGINSITVCWPLETVAIFKRQPAFLLFYPSQLLNVSSDLFLSCALSSLDRALCRCNI